jgi:hypothetical protein
VTTIRSTIFRPAVYTVALLLTTAVLLSSIKIDPRADLLFGVAFGMGFLVGRVSKATQSIMGPLFVDRIDPNHPAR